ncbi:Asp-tRNA(Asn)/Glu-tRNA(Gln) amidotransferase subunit GatB [Symbiobacterium thermophilum]|uniref:Aspartyl/glutamyl-tRNA(Asn/Gln) amidotransferase subunit B n=1 Tax=Symbiobacterium thermophilum (strain DSM 24528 / JCM 14929 / IAM 14863 / T) TaxID=292459 RepID=GATB_SYMTH|nr:Asp-tRNA(Asn)/Glu-tRNA(Gln) amidotransferase subunit GatB [Symbiobacterium thermophilum]Q67KJ3.1 RecName: Full=Aspartyl/glutamyl-tRNA(Asn/Gln) amidotransferase subunit B; Short=Asp/Glu-ADT subunit B [Symbiobacterium thermophilum IAM 14863]BAD41805.1 glutamyl-tRNA(Gln) amidotransferase subunit B [Symbiobacterium thermophilum IAM 14863]
MSTAKWETVIGLEVHVELSTETKIWCGCKNEFGAEPNTNVCPVCLALPGALPVLNYKAVEYTIRAGLALNCKIQRHSKFDRKNYFYADLPSGYQISQFDLPLCYDGYVDITKKDGTTRRIRIKRIHLETDAGKLLHAGDDVAAADYSLVDFNRAGVPLIEIVTEPDLRSAEEAGLFLQKLRTILKYSGVSDVKMEEGSMRCDVNLSVRPAGSSEYGVRTELKNVNSFSAVMRGIEYEEKRHIRILEEGGQPEQETRSWRDAQGISVLLRSKEDAEDYRYFPEPDLPPLEVSAEEIERIRAGLPELPDALMQRLMTEYGLSAYDASVIVAEREYAQWFLHAVELAGAGQAKTVANWQINELYRVMNEKGLGPEQIPVTPEQLVGMLKLIEQGTITGKIAKTVFDKMVETGKDAETIVKEEGLTQVADEGELLAIAREVVASNPKVFEDWKAGKQSAAQWFVGQIMKRTRGRANPQMALKLVTQALEEQAQK